MEDMITMSAKERERAEIMAMIHSGSISQASAAEQLGLSVRQIKRLYQSYKKHGIKGVVSKKRGRASNNRLSKSQVERIRSRVLARYPDFGPTLAHEKLTEVDGFKVSLSSVRNIMIDHRIWIPKSKSKKKVHPRRERRHQFGEMVQIDGSPHAWFEKRAPKCCLIVFIDDATSALVGLRFVEAECTHAYFLVAKEYLSSRGRPLAFYSDKHGIFRVNHGGDIEKRETQFGRAMKELGIQTICAHSPQAKGRVERANATLQDRLVKELRLRGISNIEDANTFLPEFMEDHNRRFSVEAQNPTDAHRALNRNHDLERILSIHDTRQVSKSLSFQYESTHYQILEEGWRARQLIGKKVLVVKTLTGKTRVFHKDKELMHTRSDLTQVRPKTLDCKILNPEFDRWLNKKPPHRPAKGHPLRRYKLN